MPAGAGELPVGTATLAVVMEAAAAAQPQAQPQAPTPSLGWRTYGCEGAPTRTFRRSARARRNRVTSSAGTLTTLDTLKGAGTVTTLDTLKEIGNAIHNDLYAYSILIMQSVINKTS